MATQISYMIWGRRFIFDPACDVKQLMPQVVEQAYLDRDEKLPFNDFYVTPFFDGQKNNAWIMPCYFSRMYGEIDTPPEPCHFYDPAYKTSQLYHTREANRIKRKLGWRDVEI